MFRIVAEVGVTHYEHYPFKIGKDGRTAINIDEEEHIRQLIEQVLFTAPGERVNRPTFGTGINQLVFAPNSPELAATIQFLIQGALQQWLGDLIMVESVEAESQESTLHVSIQYVVRRDQQRHRQVFSREV